MEANIDKQLLLSDICKDNLVGRSYLQKLFREKTGGGAIDYFNKMKIDAAKKMIRESSGNFTEISMRLGYNSIHYFSRQFKGMTGMTLSEYASSVKILTNKN
jgi:YesN/AraC family two-component response regulator